MVGKQRVHSANSRLAGTCTNAMPRRMEPSSHEQGQHSADSKRPMLLNAGPCLQFGTQLLQQGVQDLALLAREACKAKVLLTQSQPRHIHGRTKPRAPASRKGYA